MIIITTVIISIMVIHINTNIHIYIYIYIDINSITIINIIIIIIIKRIHAGGGGLWSDRQPAGFSSSPQLAASLIPGDCFFGRVLLTGITGTLRTCNLGLQIVVSFPSTSRGVIVRLHHRVYGLLQVVSSKSWRAMLGLR